MNSNSQVFEEGKEKQEEESQLLEERGSVDVVVVAVVVVAVQGHLVVDTSHCHGSTVWCRSCKNCQVVLLQHYLILNEPHEPIR